ncbi:uncharacterized protein FFB14_13436 [Fusarium fujikuroi]|nr:uncharacterized protein FFB14_13436 [Fusarium fujikuroi]
MNSQAADGMQQPLLMSSATLVIPNATMLSTRSSLNKTTLPNGDPSMILAVVVEARTIPPIVFEPTQTSLSADDEVSEDTRFPRWVGLIKSARLRMPEPTTFPTPVANDRITSRTDRPEPPNASYIANRRSLSISSCRSPSSHRNRSATRSHARPLFSHSQMSALLFLTQLLSLLPTFHELTSYCYPHLCLNDLNSGSALVSNSHKSTFRPNMSVDTWRLPYLTTGANHTRPALKATLQARSRSLLRSEGQSRDSAYRRLSLCPWLSKNDAPSNRDNIPNTPSLDRSHARGNPGVQYYRTWEQALGIQLAHATASVRPFLRCTEQPRRHIPDLAIVSSAIGPERSIPLTSRTRVSRTSITIREVRHPSWRDFRVAVIFDRGKASYAGTPRRGW